MEIFVFFRLITIVLSFLLGFFSYRIYVNTKGASKGWVYLAISGFMLFLWAGIQSPIVLFFDAPLLKQISSLIVFAVIGFLLPLGYIKLNKSFGIKIASFYSERNIIIFYFSIWALFIIYNLILMPFTEIFMELAGISHIILSIMFFIAIYPSFLLFSNTKKSVWLLFFLFTVLIAISIIHGAYASGCCNEGPSYIQEICGNTKLDYAEVFPFKCIKGYVNISVKYHLVLITGLVFGVISFYRLWRKLS